MSEEIAVNVSFDLILKSGLPDGFKNKEILNNILQSRIFINELEHLKDISENHASELVKKYLRKYKN